MHHAVILVAPVAGLVALTLLVLVAARRAARRRVAMAVAARRQPASVVHLLSDEAELREALERASRFEHEVADLVESRAARYESQLAHRAPAPLRTIAEPGAGGSTARTRLA